MNRHAAADAKLPEPDRELDRLARVVVDAATEVHRWLGPGFLEAVYEEALAVELTLRGVVFERQVPIEVRYKQVPVGDARLDLLVAKRLVVELKAVENQLPLHWAQVLSYLKMTRLQLGLLINFNVSALRCGVRRIILTP
ncbi:MAG TPA: GxxExxY protein [Polyangia bacterium]|nr:GxxExxY protein [Polyangia bacterium]